MSNEDGVPPLNCISVSLPFGLAPIQKPNLTIPTITPKFVSPSSRKGRTPWSFDQLMGRSFVLEAARINFRNTDFHFSWARCFYVPLGNWCQYCSTSLPYLWWHPNSILKSSEAFMKLILKWFTNSEIKAYPGNCHLLNSTKIWGRRTKNELILKTVRVKIVTERIKLRKV